MKNIDFQDIGISELSQQEMTEIEGGSIIALLMGALIGFCVTVLLLRQ